MNFLFWGAVAELEKIIGPLKTIQVSLLPWKEFVCITYS